MRAGDYSDCADAHIVVMAAGKAVFGAKKTRLDMFDDSIKMMNTIVGPLKSQDSWNSDRHFNPADIIADFLKKKTGTSKKSGIQHGTSLDSARLRRMLSEITGVSRHSIQAYCG